MQSNDLYIPNSHSIKKKKKNIYIYIYIDKEFEKNLFPYYLMLL